MSSAAAGRVNTHNERDKLREIVVGMETTEIPSRLAAIEHYLEADSTDRAKRFREFRLELAGLKAGGDAYSANEYARRAVSPLLDYTSLAVLSKFRSDVPQSDVLRVAVLGGPTTTQLVQYIDVFLWGERIPAKLYQCDFGLFRQEILLDGSGLDEFAPHIVFLAVDAHDISQFPGPDASDAQVEDLIQRESDSWTGLWETARRKWNCIVIQNTFASAGYPALGSFAARVRSSAESFVGAANQRLASTAPTHVVIHDIRLLVNDVGGRQWYDPRFHLEAKMPCAPECLVPYAHSVVALIRAIRGKSKKVLVLDLDNTLWGGIVGDVGVDGIQLGQGSAEGEAFLAFQSYAKSLCDRGILLAVCSKNDDGRAREPFEKRRDMLICLDHISCFRANWGDKPSNLKAIAASLNLGLDSFVFVDDNPAERALVRRVLPEVSVPDMPEDPAGYPHAVSLHHYFETVSCTAEDIQRSRYYRDNALRTEMAHGTDLDSFLKSLDMVALCQPVGPINIQRVTQLLNKSNQFNLTTRRYTQAQVEAIAASPDWTTLTLSLRDRCGDNGLISILFFERDCAVLRIDTWLMSCRVLQRGVESFALAKAVATAKAMGCGVLEGRYIPSGKNEMVRDHYPRLGFESVGTEADASVFRLAVAGWTAAHSHIREES